MHAHTKFLVDRMKFWLKVFGLFCTNCTIFQSVQDVVRWFELGTYSPCIDSFERGHSTHSQLWMVRHVEPTTKANDAILIKEWMLSEYEIQIQSVVQYLLSGAANQALKRKCDFWLFLLCFVEKKLVDLQIGIALP